MTVKTVEDAREAARELLESFNSPRGSLNTMVRFGDEGGPHFVVLYGGASTLMYKDTERPSEWKGLKVIYEKRVTPVVSS